MGVHRGRGLIYYYPITTFCPQKHVSICEYAALTASGKQQENPHEHLIFKHSCGFFVWCEGGDLNPIVTSHHRAILRDYYAYTTHSRA